MGLLRGFGGAGRAAISTSLVFFIGVVVGCSAAEPESAPTYREMTSAELVMLDQAQKILVARCMTRQGIRFWVLPAEDPGEGRRFPYVIDDIDWARKEGFGGARKRKVAKARAADPNRRYFLSLSPPRRAAVNAALIGGRPDGLSVTLPTGQTVEASDSSCVAEAQRDLYGDLPAWFRARVISTNLPLLYIPKVRSDPRFTTAVAAWAGCMRRSGLPYAQPVDLRKALPKLTAGLASAQSDAIERRLAVAEATCALRTPLSSVVQELDRQHGDIVRTQYQTEVQTRNRLQLAALPRADELVRSDQSTER